MPAVARTAHTMLSACRLAADHARATEDLENYALEMERRATGTPWARAQVSMRAGDGLVLLSNKTLAPRSESGVNFAAKEIPGSST